MPRWCVMFPDATLSTLHSIACSVRAGRGEKLHVSEAKTCHRSKQTEIWDSETTGHAPSRFL
jgi:hypothetical protein